MNRIYKARTNMMTLMWKNQLQDKIALQWTWVDLIGLLDLTVHESFVYDWHTIIMFLSLIRDNWKETSLPGLGPDCFTPPNGATYMQTSKWCHLHAKKANAIDNNILTDFSSYFTSMNERPTSVETSPSLTPTIPYSSGSETHQECWIFL